MWSAPPTFGRPPTLKNTMASNISMELWLTTGGNVFGYVGKYSESNEFLTVSDPRKKIAKLGRCLTKNFFFYFWTCLGEWGKRKKTLSSTLVLFPGTFVKTQLDSKDKFSHMWLETFFFFKILILCLKQQCCFWMKWTNFSLKGKYSFAKK